MRFEWGVDKNRANYRKHGVTFDAAARAFLDPDLIMVQDREVDGEERWQTIGMAEGFLILLVAHTVRDEQDEEITRIISAREATRYERRDYEPGR